MGLFLFNVITGWQEINLCLRWLPALRLHSDWMKLNLFGRGLFFQSRPRNASLEKIMISCYFLFLSLSLSWPLSCIRSRSDEFWWPVLYLGEALSPHCKQTKDAWQEAACPVWWRTFGEVPLRNKITRHRFKSEPDPPQGARTSQWKSLVSFMSVLFLLDGWNKKIGSTFVG